MPVEHMQVVFSPDQRWPGRLVDGIPTRRAEMK